MSEEVLTRLLTMSVQASALILTVMLLRLLTKKSISPRLHYALWLFPALRLLLPFRFTSKLSLMGLARTQMAPAAVQPYSAPAASLPPVAAAVTPALDTPAATTAPQAQIITQTAGNTAPSLFTILFWIWVCGAALVLAFTLYVNLRFSIKTVCSRDRVSCDCKLPVYRVPGLASPCLHGCFRPVILVNGAALRNSETLSFVLKHELCHLRAGDPWWALLRSLCCALHWFNPLVWWAALMSRADCELACDARVMKGLTQAECERYGMALLSILRPDKPKGKLLCATTAMTGGKRELTQRVKNIGRRPRTLWFAVMLTLLVLAAVALAACSEFQTDVQPVSLPVIQTARVEQMPTPGSWEQVETLVSARRYPEAMAELGKMDLEEARELLARLRYIVNGDYIACAGWTVAALTPAGNVALSSSEDWSYKQEMLEAYNWSGITALSLRDYGVVGIGPGNSLLYASRYTPEYLLSKSDTANIEMGRALEGMASWPPAYVFDACYPQTAIALTAEGVYASYPNSMYSHVGKLDGWSDVVDVRDGRSYALGLRADGTVLYRDFGSSSVLDVSAWRDIVAIDAGWSAVGLNADGTVVSADSEYVKMDVSSWSDIIAVSTCEWCTLGLKADGTVVATGDNRYHQLEVSDWRDIVAIDTSTYLSIGLKADGTLVLAGDCSNTNLPLPDVSGMTGLYVPAALESAAQNLPETYDFDGDGLTDSVSAEVTPVSSANLPQSEWNATLTVSLGNGQTLQKVIDGWWWNAKCVAGDFDVDGKTDIALIMEAGGSNYGATGVFIYRMENGTLIEFPNTILPNEKIKYAQQEYTSFQHDQCACVGASVLHEAGGDILRLRMLNDYDPGANNVNAWYIDTVWNGDGWHIENMNLGEAYGEDKLIEPALETTLT